MGEERCPHAYASAAASCRLAWPYANTQQARPRDTWSTIERIELSYISSCPIVVGKTCGKEEAAARPRAAPHPLQRHAPTRLVKLEHVCAFCVRHGDLVSLDPRDVLPRAIDRQARADADEDVNLRRGGCSATPRKRPPPFASPSLRRQYSGRPAIVRGSRVGHEKRPASLCARIRAPPRWQPPTADTHVSRGDLRVDVRGPRRGSGTCGGLGSRGGRRSLGGRGPRS